MPFIIDLTEAFKAHSHSENALAMKAYMKHLFPFFGIKAGSRKSICRAIVKTNLTEVRSNLDKITLELYQLKEREFHYCGMEIFAKYKKKNYVEKDIQTIESLITKNSHWDTVDFIAKHILGQYLLQFPYRIEATINSFSKSQNMWLNRSTLLFQLGYKTNTDDALLFKLCKKFSSSKEFFIQKAIGWALREYGKTNPEQVLEFVKNNSLMPLSKREAIRRLV